MIMILAVLYLVPAAALGLLLFVVAGAHDWIHRWQAPIRLVQCLAAGLLWPLVAWHHWRDWR
jgi:hypothetical protein